MKLHKDRVKGIDSKRKSRLSWKKVVICAGIAAACAVSAAAAYYSGVIGPRLRNVEKPADPAGLHKIYGDPENKMGTSNNNALFGSADSADDRAYRDNNDNGIGRAAANEDQGGAMIAVVNDNCYVLDEYKGLIDRDKDSTVFEEDLPGRDTLCSYGNLNVYRGWFYFTRHTWKTDKDADDPYSDMKTSVCRVKMNGSSFQVLCTVKNADTCELIAYRNRLFFSYSGGSLSELRSFDLRGSDSRVLLNQSRYGCTFAIDRNRIVVPGRGNGIILSLNGSEKRKFSFGSAAGREDSLRYFTVDEGRIYGLFDGENEKNRKLISYDLDSRREKTAVKVSSDAYAVFVNEKHYYTVEDEGPHSVIKNEKGDTVLKPEEIQGIDSGNMILMDGGFYIDYGSEESVSFYELNQAKQGGGDFT